MRMNQIKKEKLVSSQFQVNILQTYCTLVSCILVLIVALCTVAELWNQPKYPTSEDWWTNVVYVHNVFFSALRIKLCSFQEHRKNEITLSKLCLSQAISYVFIHFWLCILYTCVCDMQLEIKLSGGLKGIGKSIKQQQRGIYEGTMLSLYT